MKSFAPPVISGHLQTRYRGAVYIRVNRNPVLDVLTKDDTFEIGRYRVLREGKDILLLTHGVMVEKALAAGELLEKEGLSAKVVSISTMKPFDYEGVAALARGMKGVITWDVQQLS